MYSCLQAKISMLSTKLIAKALMKKCLDTMVVNVVEVFIIPKMDGYNEPLVGNAVGGGSAVMILLSVGVPVG